VTLATVAPPAHLWIPPGRVGSYGDEVAGLAQEYGRPLDSAQLVAVDAINSFGPGGRWHTLESAVIGPRQTTGKSGGIALPTVLADCVLWPDESDRVAWTAHLAKTHRETFDDVQRLIEGCEALSARVKKVIDNHDENKVIFTNGSVLEFLVRSPGNGRGLGGRTVVIDEALFAPTGDMGALLPVMAARPNPRVIYLSSAAKISSLQLQMLVRRGRAGNDPSLTWCEWCAPGSLEDPGCALGKRCRHQLGTAGCVLDDPDVAKHANPGVAVGRLRLDVLLALRRALSADPTEYAREFYGWHEWAPDGAADTIPLAAWDARTDLLSSIVGDRVVSVDVSPRGDSAAIAGAGYRADGGEHLSLVDHRNGTSWVVPRILQLLGRPDVSALVVDEGGPAAELIPDLEAAGLRVRDRTHPAGQLVKMNVRDVGAAAGMLRTRIAGDMPTAWHRGEDAARAALAGAGRRNIGNGGWGFDRRTSQDDITPIVAISHALWGLVAGVLPEVSLHMPDPDELRPADPVAAAVEALQAPDAGVPGWQRFSDDVEGDEEGGSTWIG
jgi:hypothetical protein